MLRHSIATFKRRTDLFHDIVQYFSLSCNREAISVNLSHLPRVQVCWRKDAVNRESTARRTSILKQFCGFTAPLKRWTSKGFSCAEGDMLFSRPNLRSTHFHVEKDSAFISLLPVSHTSLLLIVPPAWHGTCISDCNWQLWQCKKVLNTLKPVLSLTSTMRAGRSLNCHDILLYNAY